MDDAERMMIEQACTRLVVQFCQLVDAYRHEDLTALFAADAVWGTWKGPLKGSEAIRAYLDAKTQTGTGIHLVQNILIEVADTDSATGTAAFVYYDGKPGDAAALVPRVVGRYSDVFTRTAQGWRFARRETQILLTA